MTKKDCIKQVYAWTSASGNSEQIKVWTKPSYEYFFLDNGAECTHLITQKDGQFYYKGGGWLEKLLGNSFKGTSEDVDNLVKWTSYSAIAVTVVCIAITIAIKKH